jgi:hypothetical protein
MTGAVEWGTPPPAGTHDTRRKSLYDEYDAQLRSRPGQWAKLADVDGFEAGSRWYSAGRPRGWKVSLRRNPDGLTVGVWAVLPDNSQEAVR